MNEKELKSTFVSSINSGHIQDSIFPSTTSAEAASNRDIEIRIKDEGYFRSFDLVIAILEKRYDSRIKATIEGYYDNYYNLLMRTALLSQFAKRERCRIDWIRFYPVEIKSDNDVLDERLINQVLNAILTFGRSIVVLDERHTRRIKKLLLRLLPSTVIGYTGKDDHFQVLSVFDRFVAAGMFNISKRGIARFLVNNGYCNSSEQTKIYQSLSCIERINLKLAYSQFFCFNDNDNDDDIKQNGYDESSLSIEEAEFLRRLIDANPIFSEKKQLVNLIKDTTNRKITDYL
jgi:hypothetical protein